MVDAQRVVIVGGGFGGLFAARSLRRAAIEVTLVDRRNFHLFQPLLYQVATGGLSPANIATPLRAVLKRQRNCRVLLGEAVAIDAAAKRLLLKDGELAYDTLIVATGATHNYFGNPQWERWAPGLKSIEDATEIRSRVLGAFEAAERESDAERRRGWLTFVVAGGGATGVELAGALAELCRHTLQQEFRAINPGDARVVLVQGGDRVLPAFPPELSEKAAEGLRSLGVEVRTNARVTDVRADGVSMKSGDQSESFPARNVLWAAGVKASPLGKILADATGAALDPAGRIRVEPDCSLVEHPELFVIGDLAVYQHGTADPLPGVAQVAMQQGAYVAQVIRDRLRARTPKPFRYRNKGSMATIGRALAVADLGWLRLSGYPAWLAWLFIHLAYLVQFQNRLLVLIQWAWGYVSWNRSARLITGPGAVPLAAETGPPAPAVAANATPAGPAVALAATPVKPSA